MLLSEKASEDVSSGGGRGKRGLSGRRGEARAGQVLVCLATGGRVHGVHVRAGRAGLESRRVCLGSAAESAKVLKELGAKCPVVAILPRSLYLLRVFELPKVLPEEAARMLELEASAAVPPEYGAVEVSYRPVGVRKEGYERYEAYIARREELGGYLSGLEAMGIRPQVVLPSAVAWVELLGSARDADLLVAAVGEDQLEAVSAGVDGTVNIRTIVATGGTEGGARYQRGLVESVRPLLGGRPEGAEPVTVGWIGPDCPQQLANGRIVFKDGGEVLGGAAAADADAADGVGMLLHRFAAALAGTVGSGLVQGSNLLPSEIRMARERRAFRKSMLWAAGLLLAACMLAWGGMRIMVYRYQERIAGISGKIESIRKEGEAIGRRIEQLEAMRAARVTGGDFERIVAGLYDSSPPNLTYSSVELDEQGRLRLQGQAESLATAFQLPEQLEKNGTFTEVQPGDASRSKKGEGTVAEFRVDCKLNRKGGS